MSRNFILKMIVNLILYCITFRSFGMHYIWDLISWVKKDKQTQSDQSDFTKASEKPITISVNSIADGEQYHAVYIINGKVVKKIDLSYGD